MKKYLLVFVFLLVLIWVSGPQTIDSSQAAPQQEEEYLELKEFSEHYHHTDGTITFSSKLGDQNTWNGTHYNHYIWNDMEKSVQYANSKLFFYDWYARVEQEGLTVIDDLRWIVEYWTEQAGGRWNTLDLYNHQWFDPIIHRKNITFIQGFDDTVNFLNVSYAVANNAGVKVNIDYLSGEEREIRFIWQLTGMSGDLEANMNRRDFSFADIIISCNDTDLGMGFDYEWVTGTKKLDLRLGSFNVLQNDKISIDPTFSEKMETDALDFYGKSGTSYTNADEYYIGQLASANYSASIAWDTEITSSISSTSDASITFYVETNSGSGEDLGFGIYDDGTYDEVWNESEASGAGNPGWWGQSYYWQDIDLWTIPAGTGNKTISDDNIGSLIDEWVTHHNDASASRQFIGIKMDNRWANGVYIKISESSYDTADHRPTLTFTYTLGGGGNNAPNAPTLNQDSGNTYAGKAFTVITDHTDDDGAADIETMYLQHHYDTYNVTIYCFQNASSGSVTVLVGSDYLDGTPTYAHSGITNGYRVTWTITFDWDFVDDQAYTIYARTVDDEPEWSDWANLDSDNTFENDLEVESLIVAIDGDAEYGGTNAQIDDDDWFRGGVEVTASGTVQYEGSAVNFDSTYGGDVDVELYYDEGATGQLDESISDGAFSGITYTPTSASGLDTTAYFDVVLNDIPTGGSDVTAAGIEITSKRDNELPSGHTIALTADGASIGYTPNTGYYDDNSVDVSVSGATDGSGAGLPSDCYAYQIDAEGYGAWTSSTTNLFSSVADGAHTLYVKTRDNVGNEASADSTAVTVDTYSPSGFTVDFSRHTGIPDGFYAYQTGSTIYFNSGENDYFTIQVNDDGTIQTSGFWFLVWDNNSVFEVSSEDSSGLPDSKNFNYNGDSSGSFIIRVVNNAGNYQTITYTATEDVTNPTFSVSLDSDGVSIGYLPNTGYNDDDTIDFTASGAADGDSGLPTTCYSWNNSAFESTTTKQYTSQPEGNVSVSVVLRDYVGNNATESAWTIIDTVSPSGFTLTWTRMNSTYPIEVYELNSSIYFDPGNLCNNYTSIIVNDDGTISSSGFWKIEWDKFSVFEVGTNDTSGIPDSKDCYYQGDTNGTFIIRIINNAGNYQTFNFTAYDTLDGGCGEPPTEPTSSSSPSTDDPGPGNYKMNPHEYFHPYLMDILTDIPLLGTMLIGLGIIIVFLRRFSK